MTKWIETTDGRRWPAKSPVSLGSFWLGQVCREVGMTPQRLGEVSDGDPDWPLASAVTLFASRRLAGENVRTVEQANDDIPHEGWIIVDDEPEPEVAPDPTDAGDASNGDPATL